MIKIESFEVVGIEHAIRGMRNPMNSWAKSDSHWGCGESEFLNCANCTSHFDYCEPEFYVGANDQELMKKLAVGGPVHAKYRRMIAVYLDITAPLYWWKEFDTYKVGTVANSCSTMHKIHDKEFTWDDFSHDQLVSGPTYIMKMVIDELNKWRDVYIHADDEDPIQKGTTVLDHYNMTKKEVWWQMIQLLPSSYNQKRTIMLNYEVLTGIYKSRKDHKLDEWREFCKWIEQLPYSEIITGPREEE